MSIAYNRKICRWISIFSWIHDIPMHFQVHEFFGIATSFFGDKIDVRTGGEES